MSPASHMAGRLRKMYGIVWNWMHSLTERSMHPAVSGDGRDRGALRGQWVGLEGLEPRLLMSANYTLGVLHDFTISGTDGQYPYSNLVADGAGNLYGTTYYGGANGLGTIFEFVNGATAPTILHSFTAAEGNNPQAGLVIDAQGDLYGTTVYGGTRGEGTVFEFVRASSTLNTLHSFTGNGTDGAEPWAGVVMDSAGNLYGTTVYGGANSAGTIFKIAQGTNAYSTLYSFSFSTGDGYYPVGGLAVDSVGNLYGTTIFGGANDEGTVWELAKNSTTDLIIHSFTGGTDGEFPYAEVRIDAQGSVYGTSSCYGSGSSGDGAVFRVTPGNIIGFNTVYTFVGGSDGQNPMSGVVKDSAGNLYGTTFYGGAYDYGTIYEIPNGSSTDVTLYSFTGGNDGSHPWASVTVDAAGNIYGTATGGGPNDLGVIFELSTTIPNTPTNVTPASSAINVSKTPTLTANAFSDANGHTQAASQWAVTRVSDGAVVWVSGVLAATNSASVPSGFLTYNTQYAWQVRYENSIGGWSAYSMPTAFTTVPDQPPVVANIPTAGTIVVNQNAVLTFGTAVFTASFSDPDWGDTLQSVMITALPNHGTLTLNGVAVVASQVIPLAQLGNLAYTPNNGYWGTDGFSWNASDGTLFALSSATATFRVNAVPDLSSLVNQTMVHNTTVPISLPATAADGDTVSYTAAVVSGQGEARGVQQQVNVTTYVSTADNARGWSEKYLTDASGQYYYILPTGALYRWAGASTSTGNTLVATLDAGYYQDPRRLIYANWTGWTDASEATASALRQTYGLISYASQYDNLRGWSEKYLTDPAGDWYYILPTGALYQWTGAPTATGNTLIGTLDVAFYQDPTRVAYSWAVATPAANAVAMAGNQLTISPAATFAGGFGVYVTATDGDGLATSTKFVWVTVTNNAPVLNLSNFSMGHGQTQPLTLGLATDADGEPVTYTAAVTSVQAQAHDVEQQLTLVKYWSQYDNVRGWGEKYFSDPTGAWFYILPSGALYKYTGSSSSSGNAFQATLDSGYYQSPLRLIYSNSTGWSVANAAAASVLQQTYGLTAYQAQSDNFRGWGEKYLTDAAGDFYYILPTGDLYQWAGAASATGNTLVGTLDASFYQNPWRLVYSWGQTPADPSVVGAVVGTGVTITPALFAGRLGVYVTATDGVATTHQYVWINVSNTAPTLNLTDIPPMVHDTTQLVTLGPTTDADGDLVTYTADVSTAQAQANYVEQQLNLTRYWSQYDNARGWGEKYVMDASGNWYYILPTGALYKWAGSSSSTGNTFKAGLDTGYYQDPNRLVYANFTGWDATNEAAAYTIEQAQGLTTYWAQYNNYRGWGEKYLTDAAGNFYYILPTGALYKWNGINSATGNTLEGTVDTAFYQDPSRLVHSWAVTPPPSSAVGAVSGTDTTLAPGSAVGAFAMYVTATDGIATARQYVWVTVTNATPTITLTDTSMLDGDSPTVTLGLPTDSDNDAVTYTADVSTVQAQAQHKEQQLGLTTYWAQYNNARGWGEKYLTDAAGNFYYILPTGAVYKWAGANTSTGNTLEGTLDSGYYQDPSRLVYANFTGWTAANEATAYTLEQAQGMTGYWAQFNNARGWGEKYMTDAAGHWYYILSTGDVYEWNGASTATGNTLVGTVDAAYYQNPARLVHSWAVAAPDPSVVGPVSGTDVTITPGAYTGQFLVYVTATDGIATAQKYVWMTAAADTLAGLSSIGMTQTQPRTVTLGPAVDGSLDPITYTVTVSSAQDEANDIQQQVNVTAYWAQYNGARGWGEKYLTDATGQFYYILPTGALYKWNGINNSTGNTFIATLDTGYYQDPRRLIEANFSGWSTATEAAAYALRQTDPGQPTYWPQYNGARGWGEKYFMDSVGRWHYILSTGDVYQWNGSSNPTGNTLVGTVDTAFYEDPSRLMYSWAVPAADPSVLSVTTNQLTITPGSFTGQLVVYVTSNVDSTRHYYWVAVS